MTPSMLPFRGVPLSSVYSETMGFADDLARGAGNIGTSPFLSSATLWRDAVRTAPL
jgi:hypothetical protein